MQYHIRQDRSFIKVIDIERPFFSAFANWGGGIYIGQLLNRDSITFPDSVKVLQNFKFNNQDFWMAKSWRLFSGKSELLRTTNLVVSARYNHIHYLERPSNIYDSLSIYTGEHFTYFGVGIASRQYRQDTYIFNYGLTEDVPKGKIYSLTAGYQVKNNKGRWYLGLRASLGDYYPWGYLSTNLEYGRFINQSKLQEGALVIGFNYFSELLDLGRWKVRQFVKPQFIFGIRRLATDKLTIDDNYGITGFYSREVFGTHKMLLSMQTQTYAPWNVYGFRFGPYFVCSLVCLVMPTTDLETAGCIPYLAWGC
ncbi:MAG: hypothetical protein HC905_23115 [Bacteroidales bacterium]|nr:hypothetical protein [Bacteroidales bacterium]